MGESNALKELWNFMKQQGFHADFESYEDWRFKTRGEKETLEKWKKRELSDKDQQRFDYIFGD